MVILGTDFFNGTWYMSAADVKPEHLAGKTCIRNARKRFLKTVALGVVIGCGYALYTGIRAGGVSPRTHLRNCWKNTKELYVGSAVFVGILMPMFQCW